MPCSGKPKSQKFLIVLESEKSKISYLTWKCWPGTTFVTRLSWFTNKACATMPHTSMKILITSCKSHLTLKVWQNKQNLQVYRYLLWAVNSWIPNHAHVALVLAFPYWIWTPYPELLIMLNQPWLLRSWVSIADIKREWRLAYFTATCWTLGLRTFSGLGILFEATFRGFCLSP